MKKRKRRERVCWFRRNIRISRRTGPRPQQPGSLAAGSRVHRFLWCQEVHKFRPPLCCAGRAYRGGGGPDHNSQDPLRQEAAATFLFGARRGINSDRPSAARDAHIEEEGAQTTTARIPSSRKPRLLFSLAPGGA
ncbi:hypothetical protein NDU88_001849 [Pleurodeles waltl]|uniref:Uncharacterized protein n=1 Tax=Pleurodeles waltl TaxID=8319 RepID=A0AAV7W043_PLEWA|nr:hypothetical protein NDU88_001849 [Pleurodeles waltl]